MARGGVSFRFYLASLNSQFCVDPYLTALAESQAQALGEWERLAPRLDEANEKTHDAQTEADARIGQTPVLQRMAVLESLEQQKQAAELAQVQLTHEAQGNVARKTELA